MKKQLIVLALWTGMGWAMKHTSGPVFNTDIEKAFSRAKRENKPLLVDFYGIWCPPCNELEETVFEASGFASHAAKFVLLKVDADAKSSWKLKDKYKVGGYPTVVFTDASGKETYRIVGYRAAKEFFRVMDLVAPLRSSDLKKSCRSDSAEDLWRCAVVCRERKENLCAEEAFKKLQGKLKAGSARFEEARTFFVESAANTDLKRDGYERLMADFPKSPKALAWATDYLEILSEQKIYRPKKDLVEKVLSNYSEMAADPRQDEFGISPLDMAEMRAELLDKIGKAEESKKAWKEAATLIEKLAGEQPVGAPNRGFTIERIACLKSAGEKEKALELANAYRQKYPDEFTFHFWTAKILVNDKKYSDSLPIAQQAYKMSYGDNRIRVATLLVDLLGILGDKAQAKKIYEEVTRETQPDAPLEIRTHRYLRELGETWKRVDTGRT